jgi:putative endonuclease
MSPIAPSHWSAVRSFPQTNAVTARRGVATHTRGVEQYVSDRVALGRRGEDLAAEHLVGLGYSVVARNWRCRQGEIDIIAVRGDVLAFVEVKTRSTLAFGHPFEAITPTKLARLRRLASAWCADNDPHVPILRIDVVGVLLLTGQRPKIEHLAGAQS